MSIEAAKINCSAHQLILNARERLEVCGVTNVVSFDEQSVVLNTVCNGLLIEGSSLCVNELNVERGIVTIEGHIDSLGYFETDSGSQKRENGFFSRLFR